MDVWSLGVILYELLHWESPKPDSNVSVGHILLRQYFIKSRLCSPEVIFLIEGLLAREPAERLTLDQIFSSEWVVKMATLAETDLCSEYKLAIDIETSLSTSFEPVKTLQTYRVLGETKAMNTFQCYSTVALPASSRREKKKRSATPSKLETEIEYDKGLKKDTTLKMATLKKKNAGFFGNLFTILGCGQTGN